MRLNDQNKNTIKTVLLVLLSTLIGEGIFGIGLYWPVLLFSLDWSGVYWLAFVVGILVGVMNGISIGLPSLFFLLVIGAASLIVGSRRGGEPLLIVLALIANVVFDKVFGISWSLVELVLVLIATLIVSRWFESHDSIKLNY